MNTIILAFNIISPLIILLAIGYFIKLKQFIGNKTISEMNSLVYNLLLPMAIFINIYESDFKTDFDIKLIVFSSVALIFITIIAALTSTLLTKDKSKRAAFIQASFRGNFIIFGLPLAINLYGDGIGGMISIVIAFIGPLSNILAVLILELYADKKIDLRKIIFDVIKNPMIIASLSAIILVLSNVKIPVFAEESVIIISDATTTISLILLGASFRLKQELKDIKLIGFGVFNKLVLLPTIVVLIAIIIGFRNEQLAIIMTLFTAPAAISCFPMAIRLKANGDVTSGILVYSYVFCIVTIFIFIVILKSMSLI